MPTGSVWTRADTGGRKFSEDCSGSADGGGASEEVRAKIKAGTIMASQGVPYREVLPYVWADGTERVADVAIYPIRDRDGAGRIPPSDRGRHHRPETR